MGSPTLSNPRNASLSLQDENMRHLPYQTRKIGGVFPPALGAISYYAQYLA